MHKKYCLFQAKTM